MSGIHILFDDDQHICLSENGAELWMSEGDALLLAHSLIERLTVPPRENLTEAEFRQCLPDNGAFADWECVPACLECGANANAGELLCDDCEFIVRQNRAAK